METNEIKTSSSSHHRHHRQHIVISGTFWLGYILLSQIPLLNFVMLCYIGSKNRNASITLKNFSRAYLLIIIALYVILLIIALFCWDDLKGIYNCLQQTIKQNQIAPTELILPY